MDPITIASAAIQILQAIIPYINDAVKKGLVSVEDQAALMAKIEELRNGKAFEGKEWEVTPE
jgi:GTP1/Obg family GTP-binding protein